MLATQYISIFSCDFLSLDAYSILMAYASMLIFLSPFDISSKGILEWRLSHEIVPFSS